METNAFIAKLKVNGSEKDVCDLAKTFDEFIGIIKSLSIKDQGSFSLNVLCVLIRNLEQVPTWGDSVNIKDLLTLSIECVRQTRCLDEAEQVKALGCVFRLHKHVVSKKSSTPPELVLKLSFMPFEYEDDSLLNKYYKTYGHIIIDRLTYIEKLKSTKLPILKLLPKLIEDITKVIRIYDTVQFCTNMLTFLVKKLYYIYNESPEELSDSFGKIFDCISKNDLKSCQKVTEKDALDLYAKLNECLYTITENSLKNNLKHSIMDSVTRFCVSLLGHRPDMFHCFQTIYLNSLCCIFNDKTNLLLTDNLLRNLLTSCEMTEKMGYKVTMYLTYPFISQLFRLYIEHNINNVNSHNKSVFLNETIQESCLKLVLFLLEKLKKTKQLTKCENCTIKTGLHDALRLSLSVKHFVTISTDKNIELSNNFLIYFTIVEQQYFILESLQALRCPNHERCFRKLQIDVHNIAVMLNKYKYYEYSIKLFEIYLKYELKNIKNDAEMRNISRALYNKSICELDAKLYKKSLLNAYLSLVFSLPEGLKSEKYMSLVIDVKSKALKSDDNPDESNELQSLSVLHACDLLYNDEVYGNLKLFLKNIKFSSLLKHEFSMYLKLWASIIPISGVWKGLFNLTENKYRWVRAEDKKSLLWSLYEVVLETPTVVRNIHDDCYKTIVNELVANFQNTPEMSTREKLVYGTILLLKSEYDMAEASLEHGWKVTEHTTDPDKDETVRTMQQEYNAIGSAVLAVEIFNDAVPLFESDMLPSTTLRHIAQILCVSVQQLVHLHMFAHGLQLAYIGCCVAEIAGDKESYILHASALIYRAQTNKQMECIITRAMKYAGDFIRNGQNLEAALCLICDVAIYYTKSGSVCLASKLVQSVQVKLLTEYEKQPDAYLELSVGRLLEAQAMLCPGSGLSTLSAVNALPRHYLAVRNTATRWTVRRAASLYIKSCITSHGCRSVRLSRRLSLRRRATCAAAATLPPATAAARATVYGDIVNTHDTDAQVKIAHHLKYILKLDDNMNKAEETVQTETTKQKQEQFVPKTENVEIMLDSMFQRTQITNEESLICSIPAFKLPDFLHHAKTCECYACVSPACMIIACQISYLEASTYFRAKETEIAKNYFDGALTTFGHAEEKLKNIYNKYKIKKFSDLVIDTNKKLIEDEFKTVQLEFFIELSLFELSLNEFAKCDDHVVSIHEILSEFKNVDPYLKSDVLNLMVASANLRKTKITQETGLEIDMEELKLSPDKLKTPETKMKMPIVFNTVKVVKNEELPNLAKGIRFKLDFDAAAEIENTETQERKTDNKPKPSTFKVPVPVTSKPVLENLTPRPSRVKPKILITQKTLDTEASTPKADTNLEFFTPCQSTPAEFFTPMSTIKTYSKKRNLVAKNLEHEFLTPKGKVESKKEVTKAFSKSDKDFTPFKDDLKPNDLRAVKDDIRPITDDFRPDKEDLRPKSTPVEDSRLKNEGSGRRTRSRVESGSIKGLSDKRSLKRATSPGKLVEENKPVPRPRRVKRLGFE